MLLQGKGPHELLDKFNGACDNKARLPRVTLPYYCFYYICTTLILDMGSNDKIVKM